MTEKCSFRAGAYGGRYRHLTGPAGVGLVELVMLGRPTVKNILLKCNMLLYFMGTTGTLYQCSILHQPGRRDLRHSAWSDYGYAHT
jgi:hypothetical protein